MNVEMTISAQHWLCHGKNAHQIYAHYELIEVSEKVDQLRKWASRKEI